METNKLWWALLYSDWTFVQEQESQNFMTKPQRKSEGITLISKYKSSWMLGIAKALLAPFDLGANRMPSQSKPTAR